MFPVWGLGSCAVTHGSVGRLPHLLELELLNTSLIGGDGGALDGDLVLEGGLSGLDGNLVIGLEMVSAGVTSVEKREVVTSTEKADSRFWSPTSKKIAS